MMDKIINNRFVVHDKLGEGGFGSVFLVYDQQTDEICALKLVRPELASTKNIHNKFIQEAMIWMEFGKHPNIVNVRSVDKFNGSLFVALEFIPPNELGANTLDKQIRVARPTIRKAIKWALDICEGMIYAKSRGLIAHRDLKPSNLMIDASESIKITDFGLAIFAADPSNQFVDSSPSGTPVYMPPEQFVADAKLDERSDIYSLGIILYELLSGGYLPFRMQQMDSRDYFAYFHKLHLSYELPHFDSPLYPLIAKCLAKRIQDRYSSFESISGELKILYKSITGESYHATPTNEMDAAEHTNYAASYVLLGDPNRALRHIDKAIQSAPWYMPAYNNKAGIMADLGRIDNAIKIWEDLIKKAPTLGRPHYNLGNVAMQAGDARAAIQRFKRAIELEPDYIPAIVNLAICYQEQGQAEQAIRLYDQALEISPRDSQIMYNKGFLLHETGKHPEAQGMFSKVVTLNPRHVSAFNYLGLCHQAMNQPELALECFDSALAIDPNYSWAQKNKHMLIQSLDQKRGLFGRLFGK